MGMCANGVKCEVGWVKRNNSRWFGYIETMKSEELMTKVNVNEIEGPNRRDRPLGSWKDRIKECMSERDTSRGGGLEQAKSV